MSIQGRADWYALQTLSRHLVEWPSGSGAVVCTRSRGCGTTWLCRSNHRRDDRIELVDHFLQMLEWRLPQLAKEPAGCIGSR
jgi:hypothetical protein